MEVLRDENGKTLEEFLSEYDESIYKHPSVTVDMAVFTAKETNEGFAFAVLLIKRRNHPSIGMYAMPGGFLEMDETVHEGAMRELFEETSVTGLSFRQFGTFGDLDRDPRTRVISVGHYTVAGEGSLKICAGDDAVDAELFELCVIKTGENEFTVKLKESREIEFCASLSSDSLGLTVGNVENHALASDHGNMLFCALCALANNKKEDVARLLVSDRLDYEGALNVLEEALGQMPWGCNIAL